MTDPVIKKKEDFATENKRFGELNKRLEGLCIKDYTLLAAEEKLKEHQLKIEDVYLELERSDVRLQKIENEIKALKVMDKLEKSFLRFDYKEQRQFFIEYIMSRKKSGLFVLSDRRNNRSYGLKWFCYNVLIDYLFDQNEGQGGENADIKRIDLSASCYDIQNFIEKLSEEFPDDISVDSSVENVLSSLYLYLKRSPLILVLKNISYWDEAPERRGLFEEIRQKLWVPLSKMLKENDCQFVVFLMEENRDLEKVFEYTVGDINQSLAELIPFYMPPTCNVDETKVINWAKNEAENVDLPYSFFKANPEFIKQFDSIETVKSIICPKLTAEGMFIKICKEFNLQMQPNTDRKWIIKLPA